MTIILSVWIAFFLISYNAVRSDECKKICVLNDTQCVSSGGADVYKTVVNGGNGLVKPMDPLQIENIEEETESGKYELTKITLKGLKNCYVTRLTLNVKTSIYKQYLHCPELVLIFHYEVQKSSTDIDIDLKGKVKVTVYDSDTRNKGKYGVFVSEKDHNPSFFILTNSSRTKYNGKIKLHSLDDCNSDKENCEQQNKEEKTQKYMNENLDVLKEIFVSPIIKKAMSKVIDEINTYIQAFTMGEILPDNNKKCPKVP